MTSAAKTHAPNKRLEQLRALADPTRLRILELLKKKGCCSCDQVDERASGMCVCDLQSALRLTQPTITHHLQVLRQVGLVDCRRIGPWLYCRRNQAALKVLSATLAGL
jgi:ArsR family transcriptional regulator